MTNSTKKVGAAGRFGSRYGKKVRDNITSIEKTQKAPYPCPSCKNGKVRRVSAGIWACRKCGKQFAGGAYQFRTTEYKRIEDLEDSESEK